MSDQTLQGLALVIGGALGALARALASPTQVSQSRRTLVDILLGAAFGLLTPLVPSVLPFVDFSKVPAGLLGAASLGALAFVLGFSGNTATTLAGWRLGFIKGQNGGQVAPSPPPSPPTPGSP